MGLTRAFTLAVFRGAATPTCRVYQSRGPTPRLARFMSMCVAQCRPESGHSWPEYDNNMTKIVFSPKGRQMWAASGPKRPAEGP